MVPAGDETILQAPHEAQYRLYGARFHAAAILCVLVAVNGAIWVSLSSLIQEASIFYRVGSAAVDAVALTYQITYVPGTLLSYVMMERSGLRGTVLLGGALMSVGSLLRLASVFLPDEGEAGGRYAMLLLGTTLAGLAQPPLLNVPAQLAGNWFAPHERDLVTVLGTMFSPVGNAIGVALPPLVVDMDDRGHVTGMPAFMAAQAVACGLSFLWALGCLRSYPPLPPSESTRQRQALHLAARTEGSWTASLHEVWRELCKLLQDRHFRVILWSFSGGLAFFNALLTLLSQLVQPCGYTEEDAGTLGGIFLGAGLVGALVAGVVLDWTHWYRPLLKGGFVAAAAGVVVLFALQRPDAFPATAATFGFLGVVMLPLLPISIEAGVECTYPVPEVYSSGLLLSAGNTVGIPLTFLYARLLESSSSCSSFLQPPNLFVLALLALVVLPVLTYRGPYRRLEAEKEGEAQGSGGSSLEGHRSSSIEKPLLNGSSGMEEGAAGSQRSEEGTGILPDTQI